MILGAIVGGYLTMAIVTGLFCRFFAILGSEKNWLIHSLMSGIFWPIVWVLLLTNNKDGK